MLMSHYRQPIDWTFENLQKASDILEEWRALWGDLMPYEIRNEPSSEIIAALSDDLNTPLAITHLHELAKQAAGDRQAAISLLTDSIFLGIESDIKEFAFALMKAAELFVEEIKIYQKYYTKPIYSEELARIREIFNTTNVNQRIEVRNQAKRAKRYEEADRIRDELTAMGIVLHDTKEATTWELKR